MTWKFESKVLSLASAILIASGLFHAGVLLVTQSAYEGPLSWRKPMLFGLSAGTTLLSLAHLFTLLPRRFGDRACASFLTVIMLIEVGLITLQTWRGVPSHFNVSTPTDSNILHAIEALITVATLVIAYLTYRSVVDLRHQPPALRDALISGMLFLLISCLIGFAVSRHGMARQARQLNAELVGKSGVAKFPHGVPMHAIQLLVIAFYGSQWLKRSDLQTRKLIWSITAASGLFTLYSIVQTLAGRGRMEFYWPTAVLLGLAAATIIAGLVVLLVPSRDAVASARK